MNAAELAERMSREVALVCDGEGTVRWRDERARRLLDVGEGDDLIRRAPRGAEGKLRALIERGLREPVLRWEAAVCVRDEPLLFVFQAQPFEGGVALVGSLQSQDYTEALLRVQETMGELGELHRKSEQQQRELMQQKSELQRRHDELQGLYRELSESNSGVVALHAELDEKAATLHRSDEVKKRLVANVSHEFRTPVNSILGLTSLLLDGSDGVLTPEQHKQIGFIRTAAQSLSLLTSDLLDLSKAEAGRMTPRINPVSSADLMGSLRGMLRPLVTDQRVALHIEDPPAFELRTDDGKLSQILRNLVSNALKFTEAGEVRVQTRLEGDQAVFTVRDTGIGIDPADQGRIFEEFTQLDHRLQRKHKGTGLGLALSRRLAELLGGTLTVESAPGKGSTFTLRLPRVHPEDSELEALRERSQQIDPSRAPVLVVEDDRQTLFLYERYLAGSGFQVIPVRTLDEARAALGRFRPAAVVLDIMLEGEATWPFLAQLKGDPATSDIPTLVVTVTDREQKARALGADEFFVKPLDQQWLLRKLISLSKHGPMEKVLVIDDDEVARYLLKKHLEGLPYRVIEAVDGAEGVRMARHHRPHVIFLDFVMPGLSAFEVLDELKHDPTTRGIPVILNTSATLDEQERERLARQTAAIVQKQSLSREVAIGRVREALVKAGVRPSGEA